MKRESDIQRFGAVNALLRMADDCKVRAVDQTPLCDGDRVDWFYVLKQLELSMKYQGQAYTLARQQKDQEEADNQQAERLKKARQALAQAEARTGVNRG